MFLTKPTIIRVVNFDMKRGKWRVWTGLFQSRKDARKYLKDHFIPGEVILYNYHGEKIRPNYRHKS